MKKNAYSESYIKATAKRLRHLSRNCDLSNPETVKGFIALKGCSMAFKETLVEAYDLYCKANGLAWSKPFYKRYDRLPKLPTMEKVNLIISNASKRYALAFSIIRDLGLRPIELTWLRLKDVDLESGMVTVTSAKHCSGRTLKLTPQTLAMLKAYVAIKKLSLNDRLFPIRSESLSETFRRVRNKVANKLGDPSIKSIRLYDLRHLKASLEYYKTKDLLYVKSIMGHRDLRATLRYTHLVAFPSEEYHVAVARTLDEAKTLLEQGFDYVTDIDGAKLFRKRK
ncbi:MAG: site-specific integrase [Candidatus Bathyarchaeia archaeon]